MDFNLLSPSTRCLAYTLEGGSGFPKRRWVCQILVLFFLSDVFCNLVMVEFNVKDVIWSLDFHGGEEVSSLEANMLKVAEGNGEYVKGEHVKGEYVKGYRREQRIC